ncbi:hypothetical protein N790_02160 [Arenimonas malthae CC-JY-1]|uniref:Uncharacterized protein n=1 Tax=Arenimonas malthae CC-JY-1 TaxID=1384054 RepID=A0A091B3D4_9GAMM|nr:hypothetical protein [Arenimonas malthae]KFN46226.1 hypothetical protein N790_02160 [Arenimonas malthae CC-JY-1]
MNANRQFKRPHLPRLAAVAALLLAMSAPAFAQGQLAVQPEGGRVAASATVTFRIVVRETVRLDEKNLVANVVRNDRNSPPEQRQVADLGNMQLVTLARP